MVTSPRSELLIRTVTEFTLDGQGFWSWETQLPDGKTVLCDEDLADSLEEAVADFFEAVGYDPAIVNTDPTKAHYSAPIMVSPSVYHIREYAYGAPEPYPV